MEHTEHLISESVAIGRTDWLAGNQLVVSRKSVNHIAPSMSKLPSAAQSIPKKGKRDMQGSIRKGKVIDSCPGVILAQSN